MFPDHHRHKSDTPEVGASALGQPGPFGVFPQPGQAGPVTEERPALERWLASSVEGHPVAGWPGGVAQSSVAGAALDAWQDVFEVIDDVAGDDPRWRAKRDEFAGLRSHGQMLEMRGEFVVARALAGADIPFRLGRPGVPNPDFLLAGPGGAEDPVAGLEVTAVSPQGIGELAERIEAEHGAGDVQVELEFSAYPSRLQDEVAEQVLDAVRCQAAVLAAEGQAAAVLVPVEDPKNVVPLVVTVHTRPGSEPLTWRVGGGELQGTLASAEYAVFQAGRGAAKTEQGRSLDGAPVVLAVDISRYGGAWMRSAKVWAGRLAVSEHFGADYPFAAVAVFRQSLVTPDVLEAAVGIPAHHSPAARRTVVELCERLGWSFASAG